MLTFRELQVARSPLVYLWTRGPEVLYVGMTSQGLARPLAASHEQLRDFQPGDLLRIWRGEKYTALENTLIYHLRPRFNRSSVLCPYCGANCLGETKRCWRPAHAPDASFFGSEVRSNVARRHDHGLRALYVSFYTQASPSPILLDALSPGGLARDAPDQARDAGDHVAPGGGPGPRPSAGELRTGAQDRQAERDTQVRLHLKAALGLLGEAEGSAMISE